jgi:hypothetical protein
MHDTDWFHLFQSTKKPLDAVRPLPQDAALACDASAYDANACDYNGKPTAAKAEYQTQRD